MIRFDDLDNLPAGLRNKLIAAGAVPKKKHKFNAKSTTIDGHKFPSLKEADRYCELKILEKAGLIFNLTLQPEIPCFVNGIKVCTYKGDFAYREGGAKIVEDTKGVKTAVYTLKKKLVLACHGIEILET